MGPNSGNRLVLKPEIAQRRLLSPLNEESLAAIRKLATKLPNEADWIDLAYAWRDERDERDAAFRWFDLALALHDGSFQALATEPLLRELQSDPRFESLKRKVG